MKFFENLSSIQKALVVAILATLVYAISTSITYTLFASKTIQDFSGGKLADSLPGPTSKDGEDPKEPKTESCPLNGSLHTKKAKENWDKRRPLAVMIENHTESRPQSGLSSADVIYEVVAEGGITRFMAVFLCHLPDIQVGPVRSARTYFIDWLSEYKALYAHVGGANTPGPANALGQIIDYKILDLNQFGIGFPTFWRDYQRLGHPVATEHTMYSTTDKLWAAGAKRGWTASDSAGLRWDKTFEPWKFKDDASGGTVATINVNFWEGYSDYAVEWGYEATCNCYKRKNGGQAHLDLNSNEQLFAKTVIVQFMRESNANDGYENNAHLLYQNKGQGNALVFEDGKVIEATWSKANRLAREKFFEKNSKKEISLNKGLIWIQTVPEGSQVKY